MSSKFRLFHDLGIHLLNISAVDFGSRHAHNKTIGKYVILDLTIKSDSKKPLCEAKERGP
jgi:hypothetical protein